MVQLRAEIVQKSNHLCYNAMKSMMTGTGDTDSPSSNPARRAIVDIILSQAVSFGYRAFAVFVALYDNALITLVPMVRTLLLVFVFLGSFAACISCLYKYAGISSVLLVSFLLVISAGNFPIACMPWQLMGSREPAKRML